MRVDFVAPVCRRSSVVAKFSLRRPDTQATVSLILSISSMFFVAGLAVLVLQNYKGKAADHIIWYSQKSLRLPAILVCTAIAMLLGSIGLAMGFGSADARRNDRAKQSWIGFFIGALAVTLAIVFFAFFWILKQDIAS